MDRRQQKTRAAIFDAFGTLLSSKHYSKITVQDIIDQANIGRTTFYAHFETKDDLLKEMCTDLFGHVFSESLDSERTHDFSAETGNPRATITHILYHLLDHQKSIIAILTYGRSDLFLDFFRHYLDELMAAELIEKAHSKDRTIPDDFLVNHISTSFIGMLQWWIAKDLSQTPEKLADNFMAVILPVI